MENLYLSTLQYGYHPFLVFVFIIFTHRTHCIHTNSQPFSPFIQSTCTVHLSLTLRRQVVIAFVKRSYVYNTIMVTNKPNLNDAQTKTKTKKTNKSSLWCN